MVLSYRGARSALSSKPSCLVLSDHCGSHRPEEEFNKADRVDLVVLPELRVHRQDLDLVERFIDATQAIVFCGLCPP